MRAKKRVTSVAFSSSLSCRGMRSSPSWGESAGVKVDGCLLDFSAVGRSLFGSDPSFRDFRRTLPLRGVLFGGGLEIGPTSWGCIIWLTLTTDEEASGGISMWTSKSAAFYMLVVLCRDGTSKRSTKDLSADEGRRMTSAGLITSAVFLVALPSDVAVRVGLTTRLPERVSLCWDWFQLSIWGTSRGSLRCFGERTILDLSFNTVPRVSVSRERK